MGSLAKARVLAGLAAALGLFLILPGLLPARGAKGRSIVSAVLAAGCAQISLEILAILSFQSLFGFLYSRIALLTGSFMAGLGIGGFMGSRMAEKGKPEISKLAGVQACIGLTALAWIPFLMAGEHAVMARSILEGGYYALTMMAGFLGGMQFPLADLLYRSSRNADPGGGMVYGFDLVGSAVGALIAASLLIPALGMVTTLLFLSVISLGTAGVAAFRKT